MSQLLLLAGGIIEPGAGFGARFCGYRLHAKPVRNVVREQLAATEDVSVP